MRFSAAVCALIVCLAFAGRVCAQTYTPGELAATSVVAEAQEKADAIRRRIDAPTRTPIPTATLVPTAIPTETPLPPATSTPTVPPTLTSAPSPTAVHYIATVMGRVFGPTPIPVTPERHEDRTAIYVGAGVVILAIVIAVWVLLFRPQVFILPNKPRR